MAKVSIIGAGPSGCYTGYLLAKAGFDVDICEEHSKVGSPVACTGILTKALFDIVIPKRDIILNKLKSVDIISPDNITTSIPLNEFVVCRQSFDRQLADMAENAGANIHLGHRFWNKEKNEIVLRHKNEKIKKRADILIGADGPASVVAKTTGIFGKRRFYAGHQAVIQGKFDKDKFTVLFGKDTAPGFFAWSVPEDSRHSRVGVAVEGNPRQYYDKLLKRVGGKVIGTQAGAIPRFNPAQVFERENVFLAGDAATLVKDTTGGGIITGLMSAKILAKSIASGTNYTKNLRQLTRQLWIHRKLRNILNNFSDNDYNRLIKLMSNKKVKKILCKYPREFPSQIVLRLLLAEPGFLQFLTKAF